MNQGAPFEGKDHRLNPWGVTVRLQQLGTFMSRIAPPALAFEFLGFRLYLPYARSKYLLFRVHLWRYDYFAQAYIFFSAALKTGVDPKAIAP